MSRRSRRTFLEESLLAAAAAATVPLVPGAALARGRRRKDADPIRMAVLGVRGRGRAHVAAFQRSPDAEVVAICDPDSGVVDMALRAAPNARYVKDLRAVMDDDAIDAVSIATPNHWHSLAAMWALQAGKHVYVEKPVSHDPVEGRRVVEMARATGGIVQHGTQARSMAATRDAIAWMRNGGLGGVLLATGLCYKRRESIGKVDGPQQPPETLDYDLWTGPAPLQPLMRKSLHYDWHWDFDTGNGDIGNQGVHQMDIARWGLGKDALPVRVTSCGGRLGYDDDGETPNTQIAVYDWGDDQRLVFEVRGLPTPPYHDTHIGVVFHCEHGYVVIESYTTALAFDLEGKEVKRFTGDGNHFQGFLDAVKAGSPDSLTAEVREGHLSAALCHLGNLSYRLGEPRRLSASDAPFGDGETAANEAFGRFRDHLVENGLPADRTEVAMGPTLTIDPKTERFVGERADAANALAAGPHRAPYVLPTIG